jgi:hypothetical protein
MSVTITCRDHSVLLLSLRELTQHLTYEHRSLDTLLSCQCSARLSFKSASTSHGAWDKHFQDKHGVKVSDAGMFPCPKPGCGQMFATMDAKKMRDHCRTAHERWHLTLKSKSRSTASSGRGGHRTRSWQQRPLCAGPVGTEAGSETTVSNSTVSSKSVGELSGSAVSACMSLQTCTSGRNFSRHQASVRDQPGVRTTEPHYMLTTAAFHILLQNLSTREKVAGIQASIASSSCDPGSIVSESPINMQHGMAVGIPAGSGWVSCSTQELESYIQGHVDLPDHMFALRVRDGDSPSLKRAVSDFVDFFADDFGNFRPRYAHRTQSAHLSLETQQMTSSVFLKRLWVRWSRSTLRIMPETANLATTCTDRENDNSVFEKGLDFLPMPGHILESEVREVLCRYLLHEAEPCEISSGAALLFTNNHRDLSSVLRCSLRLARRASIARYPGTCDKRGYRSTR